MRSTLLALALAAPLAVPAPAPAQAQAQEQPRVVTVNGEGQAIAAPDQAVISLGVSEEGPTAGAAMAAMGDGMAGILAKLSGTGVGPDDVQTTQLILEPSYDYNSAAMYPPVMGYIATQLVDVRVEGVEQIGPVLDAVTLAGANRVNGVIFGVTDRGALVDEARALAVADAGERAERLAELVGGTLGDVVSVVDLGAYDGALPLFQARDAAVPVAGGTVAVIATVAVTYELR